MALHPSVTTLGTFTLRLTTSPTTRTTTVQRCLHKPRRRITQHPMARSIPAALPSCTTPIRGWPSSDQRCSTSRVVTTAIRTQTYRYIRPYNPRIRLEISRDPDDRRASAHGTASTWSSSPRSRDVSLRVASCAQRRLLNKPLSSKTLCEREIDKMGQTKRRELKPQKTGLAPEEMAQRRLWLRTNETSPCPEPSIFTNECTTVIGRRITMSTTLLDRNSPR
jgi:hypothetical protein